MNANQPKTARRIGKRVILSLMMALGGLFASGNAAAQIPVTDGAHIGVQGIEFGQQAGRWIEQGRQWAKEYNEWKQQYDAMFARFTNFQSMVGLEQGSPMEKIPDPYAFNVEERCGSQYGSGTSGIIGTVTGVNMQGNIHQQRWEACRGIQVAQNLQYNEMVDFMDKTKKDMDAEYRSVFDSINGIQKNQAEMDADIRRADKMKADHEKTEDQFEKRQKAYDTYIAAQTKNQSTLTRLALRGNAGLIQQITSTAVMQNRLCGGGKCTRREGPAEGNR